MRRIRVQDATREGFAVLTVLMVLMALFVMVAPFLLTVRNANNASAELADRSSARLALDSAARHARAVLRGSHSARDATPYFDSAEELRVDAEFEENFLDSDDSKGVTWDVDAYDLSGYIDLDSAPPHLIANLTGLVTRTSRPVEPEDVELPVASTRAFADSGFLWVGGERMSFARTEERVFPELRRGLLVETDADDEVPDCGPRPAQAIPAGASVFDQRVWALAEWRVATGDDEPARLDGFDQLAEVASFAMSQELDAEFVDALRSTCVLEGDERSGPCWQRATRVRNELTGGQTCSLSVDDSRWFNPGTTVQITDGRQTELGLVLEARGDEVRLTRAVQGDYQSYEAELRPLVRRPVNVNTAPPEVLRALFENLKQRRVNSRITASEASQLVEVVLESRPFEGFRDFVERLVLPAGGLEPLPDDAPVVPAVFEGDGAGLIDEDDAVSLYLNALNANDRLLEYSTMPLSFTSQDVYALELRSVVHAKSGVERVGIARDDVELVVPQENLMNLWTRQEDFDLELRARREAQGWSTGPEATSQESGAPRTSPESRYAAHMGVADPETGERLRVYASRDDDDGWARLAPSRVEETEITRGRVMHFDRETTDPEGRDTTERPIALETDDQRVQWRDAGSGTGGGGFLRPLRLSMWLKPLAGLTDGQLLFDAGAGGTADSARDEFQSDRISLAIDEGELVLRVHDGSRDHPGTEFEEVGEVRYPLSGAGEPGVPTDTWTHVDLDIRGNRPSQMTMVVDGRMGARTPGLTRLAGALGDSDLRIQVESTEGFPENCVLRVGNEIIEASVTGETTFDATPDAVRAGRGGRMARELSFYDDNGATVADTDPIPAAVQTGKQTQHPSGASVELYGYSVPIAATVNDFSETLRTKLGPFRVAKVTQAHHVGEDSEHPIIMSDLPPGQRSYMGSGFTSDLVDRIVLGPADRDISNLSQTERERWVSEEIMPAFHPEGGYAAIVQKEVMHLLSPSDLHREASNQAVYRIGGISIVRYRALDVEDRTLFIEPGSATSIPLGGGSFPDADGVSLGGHAIGPLAFVYDWKGLHSDNLPLPLDQLLEWQTFIFPISVPTATAGSLGLLDPLRRTDTFFHSELLQIAPAAGADPETTEWVRYDELLAGHVVRSDPRFLRQAQEVLVRNLSVDLSASVAPVPPGGGGGGIGPGPGGGDTTPGGGGGGGVGSGGTGGGIGGPPPPPSTGFSWSPNLGEADFEDASGVDLPVSRAVSSALQFRGVFGTGTQEHAAGARIQPVFRLSLGRDADDRARQISEPGPDTASLTELLNRNASLENWGVPGAGDHAFLVGTSADALNFAATEVVLQHVHRPLQYLRYEWDPDPSSASLPVLGATTEAFYQLREMQDFIWFSLESPVPFPPLFETDGEGELDPRRKPRLTLFPSGELPRGVDRMAVGGRFDRPNLEGASLLVDEIVFGHSTFGPDGLVEGGAGSGLILAQPVGEGDAIFAVEPDSVRREIEHEMNGALAALPPNGGLLRIGTEIIAYLAIDAGQGLIVLPDNGGRGLLGTVPQPHAPGEVLHWLEGQVVTTLGSDVAAESHALPLVDASAFPQRGTVRVGDELVHYTRIQGGALEMPQASDEAGRKDAKGPGLFRGRYGTGAQGHVAGTAVVLHPFRYWDRWAERADAPELCYFGFGLSQPGAFWTSAFWQEEASGHAGPRLGVLQRTDPDVPWDAAPNDTPGLALFLEGQIDKEGNKIGSQADRIDWRLFATYDPGSFDPSSGLAHGWKTTPVLRLFGAECFAPGYVLRSVER